MPSVSALVLTLTSTPLSRASSQNSRSPLCAPWNSWDSSSPSTTPRFFRVRCFLFGFPLPLAFCSGGVGRYGINCSSSFRRSICTRRDSGSKTPREVNFRPSSPKREGNFGFGLVTAAAAATTEAVLPPALGFEDEDDVEAPVVASPTGAGVAAVVPPFCCCCGPAPSAPSAPSAAASPLPLLLLLLLLLLPPSPLALPESIALPLEGALAAAPSLLLLLLFLLLLLLFAASGAVSPDLAADEGSDMADQDRIQIGFGG